MCLLTITLPFVMQLRMDIVCAQVAILTFSVEITQLLLERGANPAAQDNFPIRWASHNGHVKIVEILLETGKTDPKAQNGYALKWAKLNGHLEVVALLTEFEKNPKGNTPTII